MEAVPVESNENIRVTSFFLLITNITRDRYSSVDSFLHSQHSKYLISVSRCQTCLAFDVFLEFDTLSMLRSNMVLLDWIFSEYPYTARI